MKYLLIALWVVFTTHAFANNIQTLSDSIQAFCGITDRKSFDNNEECVIYYINCVVGTNGQWEDRDIIRCTRDKK